MRIIKLAFISAAVIFLVLWLISLLFPSRVLVSRAIDVHAPADQIWNSISDLRQWPAWNAILDTLNRGGAPVTEATTFRNSSFSLNITPFPGRDTVAVSWTPVGAKAVRGGMVLHHSADSDITVVQWYFEFHLRWYPWEKFGSMVFDKQLGPMMEGSLEKLRQETEAR